MEWAELPIYVFEHEPESRLEPLHRHRMLEVGCCLEGRGTFFFGKKTAAVAPGDIFTAHPTEPHRAQSDPEAPCRFVFVLFEPSIWLKEEQELLLPFLMQPERFENRIPAHTPAAGELRVLMEAMWREQEEKQRGYYSRMKACLMHICVILLRHYEPAPEAGESASPVTAYRMVRPVLDFIDRNCGEPVGIGDAARLLHLSPSRAQARFKEAVGTTFADYLKSARVHRAKELLLSSALPVTEVCGQSGFQSQAAFYRSFEELVGMKPTEYRNRYGALFISEK